MLEVLVTPSFARAVKKLHAKEKLVVDKAVRAVASDPALGEEKTCDLELNPESWTNFRGLVQEAPFFVETRAVSIPDPACYQHLRQYPLT